MPDTARSRDVRCPFYKTDTRYQIRCEGYLDGMTTTILRFENKHEMCVHLRIFCNDNYRKCEIARLIAAYKYDDPFE